MLRQVGKNQKLFTKNDHVPNQPIAVVDVDDVIYPCTQVLIEHFNEVFGRDMTIEEVKEFSLHNYYEEISDHKELHRHLLTEVDYMRMGQVYEYAQSLMQSLRDAGFYIAVVTARGFHPRGYEETNRMLNENNLCFDAIAAINIGDSKLDFVLDNIGHSVDLVCEDSVSHLTEFAESGITTIRFERPWNQNYEHGGLTVPMNADNDLVARVLNEMVMEFV